MQNKYHNPRIAPSTLRLQMDKSSHRVVLLVQNTNLPPIVENGAHQFRLSSEIYVSRPLSVLTMSTGFGFPFAVLRNCWKSDRVYTTGIWSIEHGCMLSIYRASQNERQHKSDLTMSPLVCCQTLVPWWLNEACGDLRQPNFDQASVQRNQYASAMVLVKLLQ